MDEFLKELKQQFRGEVWQDSQTLETYSHDTSLFEIKPRMVVAPLDSQDLMKLVTLVKRYKVHHPELSLTARSGGTDMSGGAINESIIVDFSKHFNHMGSIDNKMVSAQPGVFYRDFEKETLKQQLLMPSYPASRQICAIGGMVNNNSGGEKTLMYGKTIDYVKKLKVVLQDGKEYEFGPIDKKTLLKKETEPTFEGEVYSKIHKLIEANYQLIKSSKPNVSKNSTGYNIWDVWDKQTFDMTKLFVGGQGTLGITTEATLGLVDVKAHSQLVIIYMNDLKMIPEIVHAVLPYKPDSFEAFDRHTMKLAISFMFKFMEILGFGKMVQMGLQFLPSLMKFAVSGIPEFTLLAEFEGDTQAEVDERVAKLVEDLKKFPVGITRAKTKQEATNYWLIRRESFNLLRKNIKNKHTAPFIDDFVVRPEHLVEFFPKLMAILEKYQLLYTIAGHMGDGNFHIIPLMDLKQQSERTKIPKAADEVYALISEYKGSYSGEHNDGIIRGPYLEKMYGTQMYQIFKEVKHIFDPYNLFNPHKKTDATREYMMTHMRGSF